MLIEPITYEDFDGNIIKERLFFHLTKAEILRFEMETQGSLTQMIASIVETEDNRQIFAIFERIVLAAYGVKVGDKFIKTDENKDAFKATNAYSEFIISLIQDASKGADFVNGLINQKNLKGLPQDQTGMSPSEAARRRSEQTLKGFQEKKQTPQHVAFSDDNVSNTSSQGLPPEAAPVIQQSSLTQDELEYRQWQEERRQREAVQEQQFQTGDNGLSFGK